jgi:hypothetical protein
MLNLCTYSKVNVDVYDRRMMSLSNPSNMTPPQPAYSFAPVHVLRSPLHEAHSTYAEFSPCGTSVLATYHTDHSYVFDLNMNDISRPKTSISSEDMKSTSSDSSSTPQSSNIREFTSTSKANNIPAPLLWRDFNNIELTMETKIKSVKLDIQTGNRMLDLGYINMSHAMYTRAEEVAGCIANICYSRRLTLTSQLVSNFKDACRLQAKALYRRATLYLDRRYKGDDDAGLADVERALQLNPVNTRYMLKKAILLVRLRKPDECLSQLNTLKDYIFSIKNSRFTQAVEVFYMLHRAAQAQIEARERITMQKKQKEESRKRSLGCNRGRDRIRRHPKEVAADIETAREYTIAEAFTSIGLKRLHQSPDSSCGESSDDDDDDDDDNNNNNNNDNSNKYSNQKTHSVTKIPESITDNIGKTSSSSDNTSSNGSNSLTSTTKSLFLKTSTHSKKPNYQNVDMFSSRKESDIHDCGYIQRFVGAANIATDIKEAIFFGPNGEVNVFLIHVFYALTHCYIISLLQVVQMMDICLFGIGKVVLYSLVDWLMLMFLTVSRSHYICCNK